MKNDHNYHESKRFLIIPNPEDNEFILSYLFRLKKLNAYYSLQSVLKVIFGKNINLTLLAKGDFDYSLISKSTNLSIGLIESMCLRNKGFHLGHRAILCPLCIQLKKYISKDSYKINNLCPIHFIPYISRCLNCGKLINWDANDIEICQYCNKSIATNSYRYLISINDFSIFDKVLFVYENFFNYEVYSHGEFSSNSINSYVEGLRYSINFINDPSIYILHNIRKILFPSRKRFENKKVIYNEFIFLIFNVLDVLKFIENDNDVLLSNLSPFINGSAISEILTNYEKRYFDYCLSVRSVYYKSEKMLLLTHLAILKILNIDADFLCIILKVNDISYDEKFIDIYSFIEFTNKILKRIDNSKDFKNLYDFNGLSENLKLRILSENSILLYNFNYIDVLGKIMIRKDDIKKY